MAAESAPSHDRARTPEAKQELRERILAEAIALFAEAGYGGFSMRKLAARLGYSATTIYVYFENKDELLFEVIGQGYERFRAYLSVPGGDPTERFVAIGEAYLDFAFRNPELYRLMFIERPGFLFDLREEKVNARLGLLDGVARAARRLPALESLDDTAIRRVTELLWALLHGLASLALTVPLLDEQWARENLAFISEAAGRGAQGPGGGAGHRKAKGTRQKAKIKNP